jgi:hypothetical protein
VTGRMPRPGRRDNLSRAVSGLQTKRRPPILGPAASSLENLRRPASRSGTGWAREPTSRSSLQSGRHEAGSAWPGPWAVVPCSKRQGGRHEVRGISPA